MIAINVCDICVNNSLRHWRPLYFSLNYDHSGRYSIGLGGSIEITFKNYYLSKKDPLGKCSIQEAISELQQIINDYLQINKSTCKRYCDERSAIEQQIFEIEHRKSGYEFVEVDGLYRKIDSLISVIIMLRERKRIAMLLMNESIDMKKEFCTN